MAKTFREWDVDQRVLLPPNVMDLREGPVARFAKNLVVEELDLGEILKSLSGRTGISTLPPGNDDGGDPLWILSRDLVIAADRAGLW